ncbi:hypothetical protein ABK040_000029 [Willaertia magna]
MEQATTHRHNSFTKCAHLIFKIENFPIQTASNSSLRDFLINECHVNASKVKIAYRNGACLGFAAVLLCHPNSDHNNDNEYNDFNNEMEENDLNEEELEKLDKKYEGYVKEELSKVDGKLFEDCNLKCSAMKYKDLKFFMTKKKCSNATIMASKLKINQKVEHIFVIDFEMAIISKAHSIPVEIAIAKYNLQKRIIEDTFHSFIKPKYIPEHLEKTIRYVSTNIHGINIINDDNKEIQQLNNLENDNLNVNNNQSVFQSPLCFNYDALISSIFNFIYPSKSTSTTAVTTSFVNNKKTNKEPIYFIAKASHAENTALKYLVDNSTLYYKQEIFPYVYEMVDFLCEHEKISLSSTAKQIINQMFVNGLDHDDKCEYHQSINRKYHCAMGDVKALCKLITSLLESNFAILDKLEGVNSWSSLISTTTTTTETTTDIDTNTTMNTKMNTIIETNNNNNRATMKIVNNGNFNNQLKNNSKGTENVRENIIINIMNNQKSTFRKINNFKNDNNNYNSPPLQKKIEKQLSQTELEEWTSGATDEDFFG